METLNQLETSYHVDANMVITLVIALLIAALIIFIITKMFRAVIATAVLLLVIPSLFTVTFGNGEDIVHNVSSVFTPSVEQRITESYEYFKQKENENPIVDVERVSGTVRNFFSSNEKTSEGS